jgi:uncharacterized cupredoxin-like copper-binding protein
MADGSAAPVGSAAPSESGAPSSSEARVIELEATASIRFLQDGEEIHELAVTPGETVLFRIDNTAGFEHAFYIGTEAELQVPGATTDTGIASWDSGVQELEWVVPDDLSDVWFACTVPGHFNTMSGPFIAS